MYKLERKPASWFKIKQNVRRDFPEEELREFGRSLKKKQIHPLLARSDGTLLDGERRLRGGMLEGVTEFDVIITDEELAPDQIVELQLVSALDRKGLNLHEQILAATAWYHHHRGATAKDLAAKLGRSDSWITRLMSFHHCCLEVQAAVANGTLGLSPMYELSKLPKEDQPAMLAQGGSRDAIANERKQRSKADERTDAVKLASIKVMLPGGVSIVVKGKDLTLATLGDLLAKASKAADKAKAQGLNVKTAMAMWRDESKANGKAATNQEVSNQARQSCDRTSN